MKNGSFVLDAHTGFWDASKENTKNRFGDAFIETFYAFHTGCFPGYYMSKYRHRTRGAAQDHNIAVVLSVQKRTLRLC
jgi:hypothetical protein